MLKIKIPPRSEQEETDQQPVTVPITPTAEFWTRWQREFEEPEDLMEYDVGDFQTAVQLSSVIENFVWPDFKVGVEGTGLSSGGSTKSTTHVRKTNNQG